MGKRYLPGKYPGSKLRLMQRVWRCIPRHEHFVALFGGIGGEIVGKPLDLSRMETFNDLNRDVCNAFRHLQHQPDKLIRELERIPYAEEAYWDHRCILLSGEGSAFERAVSFWVVASLSVMTSDPTCSRYLAFRMAIDASPHGRWWANIGKRLRWCALRLRYVQVINRHWTWVIRKFNRPGVFFSADPPWIASTLATQTPLYTHAFRDADHEELLTTMRKLNCQAMIWGYDHPIYRALLSDWYLLKIESTVSMNPKERGARPIRKTLVWFNYDPKEVTHD